MNKIEFLGILASIIIFISLTFKTSSYSGTLKMRSVNLIGSALFIVYACFIPAYSVIILNALSMCVNITHIILESKLHHEKLRERKEINNDATKDM